MEHKAFFKALLSVHKIIARLSITDYRDILKPSFLEAIPKKVKEQLIYEIEGQDLFYDEEVIKRVNIFITSCHYLSYRSLNILLNENILNEKDIAKLTNESILRLNKAGKKTVEELLDLKSILLDGEKSSTHDLAEFISQNAIQKLNEFNICNLDDMLKLDYSKADLSKKDKLIINNLIKIIKKDNTNEIFSIFDMWKSEETLSISEILSEELNKDITLMFYDNGVLSKNLDVYYPKINGKFLDIVNQLELFDISRLTSLTYKEINDRYELKEIYITKLKHLIVDKIVAKDKNEIIFATPMQYIVNKYKNNILKSNNEKDFINLVKHIKSSVNERISFRDIEILMLKKSFSNTISNYEKSFEYAYEIFMNIYASYRNLSHDELETKYNEIVLDVPMNDIINTLIEREIYTINEEGIITLRARKIENIIKLMEESKNKIILQLRLSGNVLEEIGSITCITRERVRQILKRTFNELPRNLYEDRYRYIYENYSISKEISELVFQMKSVEYYYLRNRYDEGENSIDLLLEDENVILTDTIVEKLKRYLNKDYIVIDDEKIKKKKSEILLYLIKVFCSDLTKIEDLHELYNEFIDEFNLDDSLRIRNIHSFEGTIERLPDCINYPKKRVKYYPFSKYNWAPFYNELRIDDYIDKDISVLAIYRNNINLMNEYKIRDQYELHNIIRRTSQTYEPRISMGRNPHIQVGNAKFKNQIIEFLIEYSPIPQEDFIKKFCEKYGFLRESILANNMFECIDSYLQNGMYCIDYDYISEIDMDYLATKVNEDRLYFVDEIKKDYTLYTGDELLATRYMFKKLGYQMLSTYIYPSEYESMKDYLNRSIFNSDIVNISHLSYKLKNLSTFRAYTQQLIENHLYIEFDYEKFISANRLSENGMTGEVIDEFINQLVDRLDDYKIYDLQKILEELDFNIFESYGFGLKFYESLFKRDKENKRIHSFSVGGNLLIRKGIRINSIIDLLEQIIDEYRSFDVDDLVYYLREEYHIETTRSFIIEKVKVCDMYYNDIMEKVYIDIDYYYEELN